MSSPAPTDPRTPVGRTPSVTDRYSAPPTSVRVSGSDARTGDVPAAPDYRAKLRDLYSRRDATTALDSATVKTRGEAVSRSLTPRYEAKLADDVAAVKPAAPRDSGTPRATPRPSTPSTGARPIEPRTPVARSPSPGGGAPTPRVAPISNRYPVPGREPRPSPPSVEPRVSPPGNAPRTGARPPVAEPAPTAPRLRPREPGTGTGPSPNMPRVRPGSARPMPGDVVGSGPRGGGPTLRPPGGRTGGGGARFADDWYRYNGGSVAGSQRYMYGCYHWSGHCAAFWPSNCGWGWYWYPYMYCGTWSRYWYNCRSSFVVYWDSCYPSSIGLNWWWPSRCYVPGSWFGWSGFSDWCDDYVDWSYVPSTSYVGRAVVSSSAPAPVAADDKKDDEPTDLAELASRHVKLGDFYFRQGRYEEASESYVRALAYAPDDGALHFVLADALFAQGDYHYAAYMVGKGLELDPGLARADADKRAFYDQPAKFEAQLDTLRTYLKEKPYDAAAHLVLGYNLRFSGRSEEAAKSFGRVLEIDPGNVAARAFLEGLAAPDPAIAPAETKRDG